jgi:peptidoglycan/LPS O-acetylase OafA/YrhL
MLAIPFAARALHPYMPHTAYLMPMAYTPSLMLLTWCLAKGGGAIMVNGASRYIGKISYSMYFWHFPVIGLLAGTMPFGASMPAWLRFLLLYVVAVALSGIGASVTYRLVEQPMIKAGRQLAARLASRRGSTAPPERSVEEAI